MPPEILVPERTTMKMITNLLPPPPPPPPPLMVMIELTAALF